MAEAPAARETTPTTPSAPSPWRSWLRPLAAFILTFVVLASFAGGERLRSASANNHYAHLAQSWLDGTLEHEGKPKGWCTKELRRAKTCKRNRHDDWARVWTLSLRDGSTVRAHKCRTEACDALRKRGVEGWLTLGRDAQLLELGRGEIVERRETWYVSFPPTPALVMLPAVALWGPEGTPDVLLTCLLAALIPAVFLRLFDRERGEQLEHLFAAGAWALGSPALLLGSHGEVWFTAQIVSALCLALYVSMAWRCHRPMLAGLALGLAVGARPHVAVAVVFFALEWWREGQRQDQSLRERALVALRFAAPIVVIGSALMAMNWARFADPFEFGHRFLDIRWQRRMQEIGMFAPDYLGRNLRCAFTLMPTWAHGPGALPELLGGPKSDLAAWVPRVSIHGSSILLGAPWVLLTAFALRPSAEVEERSAPQRWGLLLAAAAVAVPSLLYQNSGQLQFSYRFAVDWLPFVLPALVVAGGAGSSKTPWGARVRWLFLALVLAAAAWQLHGAWWFDRAPGRLFVTDSAGWPFESELR